MPVLNSGLSGIQVFRPFPSFTENWVGGLQITVTRRQLSPPSFPCLSTKEDGGKL